MSMRPLCASIADMEQRHTLHIIDCSSRMRAELARTGFAMGHHCEIYGSLDELLAGPPDAGTILIGSDAAADAVAKMAARGRWLPVVAFDRNPAPERVVAAMRAGVLDFLALPLDSAALAASLQRIEQEVAAHGAARRRALAAWQRMSDLSPREREVLEWLARGCSNKVIARELTISPRTVEIHRANMMTKLGARHAAEAIRLRLEAEPAVRMRLVG